MNRSVHAGVAAAFVAALVGLTPTPARAQAIGSAVGVGLAAGTGGSLAARGAGGAARDIEVVGREMVDWTDPRTRSTSRMAVGCDHVIEGRLSATGARDYLDLTVLNHSTRQSVLMARGLVAHFGTGAGRYLEPVDGPDAAIDPDWWVHRTFAFPSKAEFLGQTRLVVDIPLSLRDAGTCEVLLTFDRPAGVADDERTHTVFSALELHFSAGTRFAAQGGAATLGQDAAASFDWGFHFFPWPHHGFFLEFPIDAYGDRSVSAIAPAASASGLSVTGVGVVPGYELKAYPASWLSLSYGVGAGPYALELGAKDSSPVASTGTLAVRQKLKASFLLFTLGDGTRFEVGPTVVDTWLVFGTLGQAPIAGDVMSAMGQLTIGG